MGKKKRKKESIMINVTEYTEDTYFDVFPTHTEDDFLEYVINSDAYSYIKVIEKETNKMVSKVRKVVIDNEYFRWLKQTKQKNTSDARIQYMNSLRDEEVNRIWSKHYKKDWMISEGLLSTCFITFDEILPSTSIPIPDSFVERLKRILSNTWSISEKDIVIHPEFVRADYWNYAVDNSFHQAVETFFSTNQYTFHPAPCITMQDKQNMAMRYIPIAHKTKNCAIMTRKEVFDEEKQFLDLSDTSIENWSNELQRNHFPDWALHASGFWILPEMLMDFHERTLEGMEETILYHKNTI